MEAVSVLVLLLAALLLPINHNVFLGHLIMDVYTMDKTANRPCPIVVTRLARFHVLTVPVLSRNIDDRPCG